MQKDPGYSSAQNCGEELTVSAVHSVDVDRLLMLQRHRVDRLSKKFLRVLHLYVNGIQSTVSP